MIIDYPTLRSQAQDGDILLLTVNPKDYLSRLTAWWTKSQYTHAAFLFWYRDRLLVAESTTHGGSRIAMASCYQDRMMTLVAAPKPWDSLQDAALMRSGSADYGWFSAAYIGLKEWAQSHGIHLPRIKNNSRKACSEYVAELLGYKDPDISPQELYRILTSGH